MWSCDKAGHRSHAHYCYAHPYCTLPQFLDVCDLIPKEYRQSSTPDRFVNDEGHYTRLEEWWYVGCN